MNATQRMVLEGIARHQGTCTPQSLANHLNGANDTFFTWQGAARVAGQLARKRMVQIHRLSKMTYYEITDIGREVLGE